MNNYPYLKDSAFLFNLFKSHNLEQLVQITVLNFNEKPLKEIQGRVLSGSLNLDGKSSVRRTGNLSVYIDENDASYMEVGGYFSMNKKDLAIKTLEDYLKFDGKNAILNNQLQKYRA